MSTDIAALKQRINLADLIGRDTPLIRIAGTRGGEWAGPCPFCGGQDRLHVQPAYGGGRWFCRQCAPRGGDAIDYLCRRERLTFHEAVSRLAVLAPTAQPAFQTNSRGRLPTPVWRKARLAVEADLPLFVSRFVVLTVAHLDHDQGNNADDILTCMCQRCHFNYDRPFNVARERVTKRRK